ncbi:Alpha/Beta hydrolase protein [Truncatella angustata]|uniref:Alpha/Beta hydrolase protein n=1 Tax=Truncatella angustata TaxID=152316 RepID=A0A9P9A151_9PEZI|nr:Alpha/Beta hydrolase protein [Truncatella angustata]KAH6659146.1 Alpha/Beta hydrolase protein [Truncatella angustata]
MRMIRNQMEEWMNDRYMSTTQRIAMADGHENEMRIFKPEKVPGSGSPLVILVHAGGFAMGTTHQMSPFAQGICTMYGATVVCVTHRLAPEYVFPTAPHDIWDSVKWLGANAASLGADPRVGFVLGGVSSGANLTAVTVQRAVREGLSPALTGAWMCMPCLLDERIVPAEYAAVFISREQCADATLVDTKNLYSVIETAKPDVHSPDWSPFNSANPHNEMPPSYIQVSGADPMRDDGLIYERVLRKAGVKTKLNVYPGVPHWHFGFFPSLSASKKANSDAVRGIGWLLGQSTDGEDENILGAMAPPMWT